MASLIGLLLQWLEQLGTARDSWASFLAVSAGLPHVSGAFWLSPEFLESPSLGPFLLDFLTWQMVFPLAKV